MRTKIQFCFGLALIALLAQPWPARAELKHRYSFSETSGTKVKDSSGAADGTLNGGATLGAPPFKVDAGF